MQANLASLMKHNDEDDMFQPTTSLSFNDTIVPNDSESNDSFMPSLLVRNNDASTSDEPIHSEDDHSNYESDNQKCII